MGDALSSAYHAVADPLTGALHSIEEKASAWTTKVSKQLGSKSSSSEAEEKLTGGDRRWIPTKAEEEKMAAGEVPCSTAELLAKSKHWSAGAMSSCWTSRANISARQGSKVR